MAETNYDLKVSEAGRVNFVIRPKQNNSMSEVKTQIKFKSC